MIDPAMFAATGVPFQKRGTPPTGPGCGGAVILILALLGILTALAAALI